MFDKMFPRFVVDRFSTVYLDCDIPIYPIDEDVPHLIDGVQELETLLPVSKLTGRRADVLEVLTLAFNKDSRLLDALLQELPTIPSDPNISDVERVQMLAGRFDQGTRADNDALVERLMSVSDVLFPKSAEHAETIVFDAAKDAGLVSSSSD